MKKITLLIVLLSTFLSNAQYTKSALWMQDLESKKTGPFTIDELKTEFNEYWKSHDKDQKGSGFKPFMRWENHWKDLANPIARKEVPRVKPWSEGLSEDFVWQQSDRNRGSLSIRSDVAADKS